MQCTKHDAVIYCIMTHCMYHMARHVVYHATLILKWYWFIYHGTLHVSCSTWCCVLSSANYKMMLTYCIVAHCMHQMARVVVNHVAIVITRYSNLLYHGTRCCVSCGINYKTMLWLVVGEVVYYGVLIQL